MNRKKLTAQLLGLAMTASLLAGCGSGSETASSGGGASKGTDTGVIEFTCFIAQPGAEINDGNEIQEMIAEKTGVRVKETYLTGQTQEEAIGTIIAGNNYPDFINGGGVKEFYDAGALVAWDEYIEKYPNIKEMYSDEDWEKFRQEDGHIYWACTYQRVYGEDKTTNLNDAAFWIQAKVLEWAGYPKVETLDEYFQLLNDYVAANPAMEDGTTYIPYTVLCEDWRYFCIESPPQYLAGHPNNGEVIVDPDTKEVIDFSTTDIARRYFEKLNKEYLNGNIDPEFATQTYDEYVAKLSTGRVLGMCDAGYDITTVNDVFKQQGLDEAGCDYVPLGLVMDKGVDNRWYTYGGSVNISEGLAVTTGCEDVETAFKFISDVMDQDIHDLRFWGVEGVDYEIDEDGMYYRTQEMRDQASSAEYQASHLCQYKYFPQWLGTSKDGKNAMQPAEQTSEFMSGLSTPLVNCFEAYGVTTYIEMLGSAKVEAEPWVPLFSFINTMTTETPGGVAATKMAEVKHEWLPKLVMAPDFESAWDQYMEVYEGANPQAFLDEVQEETNRRIADAE